MYNEIVKNLYEVLRVRTTATQEQIKRAYLELIKKYHPDRYLGDKVYAERYTAVLTEAYSILKDPEKRRNYDEQHNINVNPTKKELREEDRQIKRDRNAEKHMPRKNYEQEISMTYFKNAERKKPRKKSVVKKFLKSKFFFCILFVVGLEIAIIILFYYIKW